MQGLDDIPSQLASALGISELASQLLLSVIVVLAILLPVLYLTRGRSAFPIIMSIFMAECLLIALGWIPYWLIIATIAVMAVAIAMLGTRIVMGED